MKLELQFNCQECGEELVVEKDPEFHNTWVSIDIPICTSCKKTIEEGSYDSGVEAGEESGYNAGLDSGADRISELEEEVDTLKELLKEREKEILELRQVASFK